MQISNRFKNKTCRLVYVVVAIICCISISSASFAVQSSAPANGAIPDTILQEYPGLDPRLVGVPIVKTDMTAGLAAYSDAVAQIANLNNEKGELDNKISLLNIEQLRAEENAKIYEEDFNKAQDAFRSIIIAQYQSISTKESSALENQSADDLRKNQQSALATESIVQWREKAQEKKKASQDHLDDVKKIIEESKNRLSTISSDIKSAQAVAKSRKASVRSGVPLALIESLEIPVLTMDAYLKAEAKLAVDKPECGLTWWALAGIGRAESNHGRFRGAVLDATGTVSPPIIGVQLNGNGFAAIGDSDDGFFDGDTEWDRAVGVMQFIPGTWRGYAQDGNGDGKIDPQNVYDASLAAARLLCANARPDMKTPEGRRTAFLRYNNSSSYANFVEAKGKEYEAIGAGRFNPAPV